MKQTVDQWRHIHFEGVGESHPTRIAPRAPRYSQPHPIAHPLPHAANLGSTQPEQTLDPFLSWLFSQAALDSRKYRAAALNRRLTACQRALKAASPGEARVLLEHHPELLPKAIDSVLIGVSAFFRDAQVFDALENRVLPQLLAARPELRVYSLGCAEGQELYSVAMLLDRLGALGRSYLVGVDCRSNALEHAAAGYYSLTELDHLEPRWRAVFEQDSEHVRIASRLRARTLWKRADLTASPNCGSDWDLILFRNLAIYLQPVETLRLWRELVGQLRPGGVLVTGRAERPPPDVGLERIEPCIFELRQMN